MYLATKERTTLPELSRTADNSAFYAALTGACGISNIGEHAGYRPQSGYRLIRVDHRQNKGSANEFEIALVDDIKASVALYVLITLLSIPEVGSRYIARHQVWRSADMSHFSARSEISQTVLFSYILQRHDLLLTTDAVIGDGEFYWHRQVSRAIELGFHVYAYDLATQALQSIPTQCALNDVQDQSWSSIAPELLQVIISSSPRISQ